MRASASDLARPTARTSSLPAALAFAFIAALAGPCLVSRSAEAQTLNQQGVNRLNQDAQQLWAQDGLPLARQAARDELQKLVGREWPIVNQHTSFKILALNSVTIDAPVAPGLTRLDGSRIEGRLPLSGAIRVAAEFRVRLKGKILLIPFDDTFNVSVELRNLSAWFRIDLDSSDPAAPRVVAVPPPAVTFQIKISSANELVKYISVLTDAVLSPAANIVARVGLAYLANKIMNLAATTPSIVGTPANLPPVRPADLEGAAKVLQAQVEATKVPFGTIFEMQYRDPYYGTWEESIKNGIQLLPTGYESIFDSTTVSGEYLAALAYRYAVTRDPVTLANIRKLVGAYRTLLTMKGEPGNLNRLIMPLWAYQAAGLTISGDKYVIRYQGEDYVASDYISRDCYWGTMYGLSHAYDLVSDPLLRDEIRQLAEMAIDYLLRNNWTWRNRFGGFGERWQGVLEQQYAWLLFAERVNPAKYGAIRAQYQGYTDILWTGFWIAVMDPYYDYYKFELGGGSLQIVLKYETDPVRWQRAYQGMAILRRFIGHHQNALLNGFYYAADPGSKAALGAENENLLTRWLRMPRRKFRIDLTNDPTIEKIPYTLPLNPALLYPGGGSSPQTILIAKSPIPVEKRIAAGFQWSVSPQRLTLGYPYNPNPHAEGESLDFLLPYWMARYHGAIRGPRPTPTGATAATHQATSTN